MGRSRWERFKYWITGECAEPGCTREPLGRRISDYCEEHDFARFRAAAQKRAERDFERDVAVHLEALRRFENERQGKTIWQVLRR